MEQYKILRKLLSFNMLAALGDNKCKRIYYVFVESEDG